MTSGAAISPGAATVVLVEGTSDQLAVEALAARRGRNLLAEEISVLAMGGATNIGRYLEIYGPRGLNIGLAGLCDEAEVGVFRRGLSRAGFGPDPTRVELDTLRFYVCQSDLEDELIRALGVPAVKDILDDRGDLGSFRLFQQMPAQRDKSEPAQLRRFMGTRGGRKIEYAPVLVRELNLDRVPMPLDRLLTSLGR
ncbi:MAG: TOPRIM nucleotidyl transferase/hydrolase domain-containing protein [Pseudonocardiales bacterium]